jgi:endonuclease-3
MMNPDKYFTAMKKRFDAERRTELYYTNEFTLAVAVILSAQATDKHVNTVTPALFAAADSPEKFLTLGLEGLKGHIKSVSFFNNKAKNIIALSEKLRGKPLPKSHDELVRLPGIGQKTANVVANILWNAPDIGVDTHVFRLAHRFGWAIETDNTPEKVERRLYEIIPKKYHAVTNHLMVMHGRYICKALRPDCGNCPVKNLCIAKENSVV